MTNPTNKLTGIQINGRNYVIEVVATGGRVCDECHLQGICNAFENKPRETVADDELATLLENICLLLISENQIFVME